VLIPEDYVADLSVRLGLYRRVANLEDRGEIDQFAAEMIDRFGKLPTEVENLLQIIQIKRLCRISGVEKMDAGPKGAVLTFHANVFSNPEKLVDFIRRQAAPRSQTGLHSRLGATGGTNRGSLSFDGAIGGAGYVKICRQRRQGSEWALPLLTSVMFFLRQKHFRVDDCGQLFLYKTQ
jgi:hypothetical protein